MKRNLTILICMIIILPLFFFPEIREARAEQGYTVSGYTRNASENPVSGVYLTLYSGSICMQETAIANVNSDGDGYFEFSNIPNGEYAIGGDRCSSCITLVVQDGISELNILSDCATPTPTPTPTSTPTPTPEPTGEPGSGFRSPSGGVGYMGDCSSF